VCESFGGNVLKNLFLRSMDLHEAMPASPRQPCVNSHQLSQWEALGTSHFRPPTKSTYLNRSLKNLSQVIRSMTSTAVQNLVKIRPWGASGQIGDILTIFRFLFIPLF